MKAFNQCMAASFSLVNQKKKKGSAWLCMWDIGIFMKDLYLYMNSETSPSYKFNMLTRIVDLFKLSSTFWLCTCWYTLKHLFFWQGVK